MQMVQHEVPAHKIERIFISHLHGDHYLGLMGLLFSMHLNKRTNELHIHAPKGLDEIIVLQLKHSKSSLNYPIHFHVTNPTVISTLWENESISVQSIPLRHKIVCNGFLFREKQKPRKIDKNKLVDGMLLQHIALLKTGQDVKDNQGNILYRNEDFTLPPRTSYAYAYCSDTAPNLEMIEQIRGVDLLYHESTFMETEKDKARETLHSTAKEAAEIAQSAQVKKLILGHFSARYRELNDLLAEARSIFSETELACEGTTFQLEA